MARPFTARHVSSLTLLLAVVGATPSEHGTPPNPIEMLIPGVHFAPDVPNYSTDGWSALVTEGSGTALRRARLHLKQAIFNDGNDHPGIEVGADSLPTTLFFVRGLQQVKEGPVETWFLGSWRMAAQETLSITMPGARRYRIYTTQPIPLHEDMPGFQPFRYDLRVSDLASNREQVLRGWNVGYHPCVQWVGDLDRDGKIDVFLYDDTPETGEAYWILFLSSRAPISAIVGRAAELHRTGD